MSRLLQRPVQHLLRGGRGLRTTGCNAVRWSPSAPTGLASPRSSEGSDRRQSWDNDRGDYPRRQSRDNDRGDRPRRQSWDNDRGDRPRRTVVRESGNERPASLRFTHVPGREPERDSFFEGDRGGRGERGIRDRGDSQREEGGFTPIDDSRDLRGGRKAYDDNLQHFEGAGDRKRFSPPSRYGGGDRHGGSERYGPIGSTSNRDGSMTVELPEGVYYKRAPPKNVPQPSSDTAEFLYGASSVQAALKARRRQFYTLFLYKGENQEAGTRRRLKELQEMAEEAGVNEVVWERDVAVLDALAKSRPHKGCILECEPLPQIPVIELGAVSPDRTSFELRKAQHTTLPVRINDLPGFIQCRDPERRFPIVLVLDEILDPGNLGAIIRSAYFLGIDALTISSKNCAPISPTTLKASSGSTEFLPILSTSSPLSFLRQSRLAGWTIIGAIPPSPNSHPSSSKNNKLLNAYELTPEVHLNPKQVKDLMRKPLMLVMGGEGEGLRETVRKELSYIIQVPKSGEVVGLVDSLNVSVAAGLLCGALVGMERKGVLGKAGRKEQEEKEEEKEEGALW